MELQVIALTTYADGESVFGALHAVAHGYLTKDASAEELPARQASRRGQTSSSRALKDSRVLAAVVVASLRRLPR